MRLLHVVALWGAMVNAAPPARPGAPGHRGLDRHRGAVRAGVGGAVWLIALRCTRLPCRCAALASLSVEAFRERFPKPGKTAIQRFAQELGIHPGIVVGRLQRERAIASTKLNNSLHRQLQPSQKQLSGIPRFLGGVGNKFDRFKYRCDMEEAAQCSQREICDRTPLINGKTFRTQVERLCINIIYLTQNIFHLKLKYCSQNLNMEMVENMVEEE